MQSADKTTMLSSSETPTPLEGAAAPAFTAPTAPIAGPGIDVKVHCCGECRRFALPADATLADVKARLESLCPAAPAAAAAPAAPAAAAAPAAPQELELAWEDEDEDKVALRTEEDWRCCLAHADDGLVRLHVRRAGPPCLSCLPAPCMAAAAAACECLRKAHAMCREKCRAHHAAVCCTGRSACHTVGVVMAVAVLICLVHCLCSVVCHLVRHALPLIAVVVVGKCIHSRLHGCCRRARGQAQGPCPCPCPCPSAPAAAAAATSAAPEQPCECECRHRGPAAFPAGPAGASFPPNMPMPPWMAAMMGRRFWW